MKDLHQWRPPSSPHMPTDREKDKQNWQTNKQRNEKIDGQTKKQTNWNFANSWTRKYGSPGGCYHTHYIGFPIVIIHRTGGKYPPLSLTLSWIIVLVYTTQAE